MFTPTLEGQTMAGYSLEARIGSGGYATIYRVRAADNTICAMKIVQRSDDDTLHRIQRFIREIRAVAALHHPAIVPIYATGMTPDQTCFWYTMPLTTHGTLFDRVMSPSDSALSDPGWHGIMCYYVVQVLLGLAAAHRQQLIHRDIKPENILIHPRDPRRVYIGDWGIAHLAGDPQLTSDGGVVGTPGYVAPEQVTFRDPDYLTEIDGRADLYATGVLLFELLTGTMPFLGKSGSRNSISQIYRKVTHDPPAIHAINPAIPRPLSAIVAQMIARDPDDRYRTCDIAAEALAPFSQ